MVITLLGIVTSVFAEVVTALNKKLNGTVLQGDAAFLIVFLLSFLGAIVHEVIAPGFTLSALLDVNTLMSTFAEIFGVSQVYFYFVMQKLNLDVQAQNMQTTTTTTVVPVIPVSSGV